MEIRIKAIFPFSNIGVTLREGMKFQVEKIKFKALSLLLNTVSGHYLPEDNMNG